MSTAGALTRCPKTLRSRFIRMTGQSTSWGEHHHEARHRLMAFPFRWRLDRRDPQRQARAARPDDAHDRYWTIAVEHDVLDRPLGPAALIARGVSEEVKLEPCPDCGISRLCCRLSS